MGIKSKIKEFASVVKSKSGFSKKNPKNPVVFYGITIKINCFLINTKLSLWMML